MIHQSKLSKGTSVSHKSAGDGGGGGGGGGGGST